MSLNSLSNGAHNALIAGKNTVAEGAGALNSWTQNFGRAALLATAVAAGAGCKDELPKLNDCVQAAGWAGVYFPEEDIKDEFGNETWWYGMRVVPDFTECGPVEVTGVHAYHGGHEYTDDIEFVDQGSATLGVAIDGDGYGTFQGQPLGEINLSIQEIPSGHNALIFEPYFLENGKDQEGGEEKDGDYTSYGYMAFAVEDGCATEQSDGSFACDVKEVEVEVTNSDDEDTDTSENGPY